jgi:L-alanine-DL-glutamate epimerase-like enolase superfamily enzyme
LRIRSVTTAVVEANFDWTIVRIEAESGVIGCGEAFFAPVWCRSSMVWPSSSSGRTPGTH